MKTKKAINLLTLLLCLNTVLPLYAQEPTKSVSKYSIKNDVDQDGVKNKRDKCPNTAPGVAVDGNGCPIDTDKDGVPDYIDKCPAIPGTVEMNGCQDKDNDKVNDFDDLCPNVPGLPRFKGCPDSDGDGVEDSKDKCPNAAGLDRFGGCPDSDGDGIEDTKDKCPDTKKGVKTDLNGCPADADGDGVLDADDKCPSTQPGVKVDAAGCPADADGDGVLDADDRCPGTKMGVVTDAKGCPADTDGDGILDADDKCPTVKGEASNNGCPVVKVAPKRLQFAPRKVSFASANALVTAASYPMLDEVANILKEYPDYNLRISGHTDAVEKNATTLAESRAEAIKSYLLGKGVEESRIISSGYGNTRPISTSKSATARSQNRRVELIFYVR